MAHTRTPRCRLRPAWALQGIQGHFSYTVRRLKHEPLSVCVHPTDAAPRFGCYHSAQIVSLCVGCTHGKLGKAQSTDCDRDFNQPLSPCSHTYSSPGHTGSLLLWTGLLACGPWGFVWFYSYVLPLLTWFPQIDSVSKTEKVGINSNIYDFLCVCVYFNDFV